MRRRRKQFADFETLLADVAKADVLFVGEQHDDVEHASTRSWAARGPDPARGDVVLALEMFERDVQEPLGALLDGPHRARRSFSAEARPWPQYATRLQAARGLRDRARLAGRRGNVPRGAGRRGLEVGPRRSLTRKSGRATQAWFARDLQCPTDGAYFKRFQAAMTQPHDCRRLARRSGVRRAATLERYYDAQCLKDETMAESIAQAYAAGAIGGKRPLVVSINGSFHSDFGDGTVERTRRRLPGKRVVVVTIAAGRRTSTRRPSTPDVDGARIFWCIVRSSPVRREAVSPSPAAALQRHPVPSRVQVVHRLHGQQHREVELGAVFGILQAQVQLVGARDHVLDHAVDRVLVRARPFGDQPSHVAADRLDEARGFAVAAMLGVAENSRRRSRS